MKKEMYIWWKCGSWKSYHDDQADTMQKKIEELEKKKILYKYNCMNNGTYGDMKLTWDE